MNVLLSQPRGFCAGVIRAIEIVEQALEAHGAPVYVVHEIVHNGHVVEDLRSKGAVFVEQVEDVPVGAVTVFSAHGVPREHFLRASKRALKVIDATCPLVTKVHLQSRRYRQQGFGLIIIGHEGHPEVEGHRGQVDGPVHVLSSVDEVKSLNVEDPERLAYVTQTTLSLDDTRAVIEALKQRYPLIQGPELEDICYATQNRQNAVRDLSRHVDVLLVVGSENSSNSNRLREVGEQCGLASYLIENADSLNPDWFGPDTRIGLTAGASAPETLVQEVVQRLGQIGVGLVKELPGDPENRAFPLPDVREFETIQNG